jgi:signal transduction histidine kinase/putative methionine-R-sulfoxide reductase with GAF domain
MLDNFVNQAAMAIYQASRLASVQRDLARKEDELNRLRRAGLLISSRLGLQETLEAILQMALEVTNAHYGIVRLVDKNGNNLITGAIAGEHLGRPLVEALPIDASSIMGWVATHRRPVCIRDLRVEPWAHIYYPLDVDLDMHAELAVPLIGASGRLEGVLNLESPEVGAFSEQDRHLLQSLATQAVIAIQEVRLLDALQEVAQLLLTQSCQQVLNRLVNLACDLLNAAASAIWTPENDQLILQVASAGFRRGERLPLHGSLTGQAILSRGPVTSDDVRTDPRFNRPDLAQAQGWRRALVVPMLASEDCQAVGAFSVYNTGAEPGRFAESEWDEKVLNCLAYYAALAVQNADHQEALRTAQEQYAVAETFAAVGDIAANLLHHLNNKVGAIPVRIQGIQDKCRPALLADLYLAANLEEIERSACEAMEAVRENLAHLHPIHLAPVNVAACVTAAVEAAGLPAGMDVRSENLDNLPAVVAGRRSLALVFTNLLDNAAAAMKGRGVITIRGTTRRNWVEIEVSDNGPGIPPELHDRIFELNFSGRGSAFDKVHGRLGFGLWWVKTLMFRLGGSVSVESDGCHGTTFRLRLPCVEDAR